jgi:hypothetical protein
MGHPKSSKILVTGPPAKNRKGCGTHVSVGANLLATRPFYTKRSSLDLYIQTSQELTPTSQLNRRTVIRPSLKCASVPKRGAEHPMKKLYAIVLISVLATVARGNDLASSFKQAAALAEIENKDRAAQIYDAVDFKPYYQQKYSPIFVSCLKSTENVDTSPFSFVVAIGKDGRVLRLYADNETNIYACVSMHVYGRRCKKTNFQPLHTRLITCIFQWTFLNERDSCAVSRWRSESLSNECVRCPRT